MTSPFFGETHFSVSRGATVTTHSPIHRWYDKDRIVLGKRARQGRRRVRSVSAARCPLLLL